MVSADGRDSIVEGCEGCVAVVVARRFCDCAEDVRALDGIFLLILPSTRCLSGRWAVEGARPRLQATNSSAHHALVAVVKWRRAMAGPAMVRSAFHI